MRTLSTMLTASLLLTYAAACGWTQCCTPYGCSYGNCCPTQPPPQVARYPGYWQSSSNYYQYPPPYMLGGPAYGYSFPYPYSAYPSTVGRSYIAPPNPSYYYYPNAHAYPYGPTTYGQSQSNYYSPSAYYSNNYARYQTMPQGQGTSFATEVSRPHANLSKPAPPPAPKVEAKAKAKSAEKPKTSATKAKQPDTLPDILKVDDPPKKPLWRKLLFRQS